MRVFFVFLASYVIAGFFWAGHEAGNLSIRSEVKITPPEMAMTIVFWPVYAGFVFGAKL